MLDRGNTISHIQGYAEDALSVDAEIAPILYDSPLKAVLADRQDNPLADFDPGLCG